PARVLLSRRGIWPEPGPTPPPEPPRERPPPPAPRAPGREGQGRKPLPASLPRKPVWHDVPPEQRLCPDCGAERTCIGQEVREQLEYVPASLVVLEHIRPKYACRACEAHVVIAQRLPEPIDKGLPGPGLMAHVAVSKYADHLPPYPLKRILRPPRLELPPPTPSDPMAVA